MKNLSFKIDIYASAKKVWQVLWNDVTYREWTSAFHEGSYAVSDWKEGSDIQFLSPEGGGMYSIIEKSIPFEQMTFKHLGEIKNFEVQKPTNGEATWGDVKEAYTLKEENGHTLLEVSLDSLEEYQDYFKGVFPKALNLVKELSENPLMLTVEAVIEAPVEKIWEYWTAPEHIVKWNHASDDWHTTKAENDLRAGGKFVSRMEAKDGSFGFDFGGKHTEVKAHKRIVSTLDDGRILKVTFKMQGNVTKVVEEFEAEVENSIELQQGGWQMILNNFKAYVEAN
ncbi:MAG: SRPBCC domain-containing protein [Chitinophagales bacterium]